nr:hypothetical protein [Tanacetum cinerariifolium]
IADGLDHVNLVIRLPIEHGINRATVFVYKSSIRFTINKKKFSLEVEIFREILQICPKILGQEFKDLPLEQDILSFVRDIGHTGDITYLTDVNVDYLHQPWRAFATVINKCLSEKAPKPKYVRKKADPDTSPKQKPIQATKGTRIETKDKVVEFDSGEIFDLNKSNEEYEEEEEYDDEFNKTAGPTQCSFVSSDFTSELINLNNPFPTDTTIASLIDITVHHEITSATTILPPPPFFNPLQ